MVLGGAYMHLLAQHPALRHTASAAGLRCEPRRALQPARKRFSNLSPFQQPVLDVAHVRNAGARGQHSRRLLPAAAVKTEEPVTASDVPGSREQSILQAANALQAQLPKEKKGKSKSTKSGSLKKLAIDIPVADQSPQAAVELVRELLACLSRSEADAFIVIFCDPEAAEAAGGPGGLLSNISMSMTQTLNAQLSGPLLIVGLCNQQVTNLQEMLFSWQGRLATLLNAEWEEEQADADLASFVKSWEYIYCFGPLEIQGFFSKREGCIFKFAKRGSPASAKWSILIREGSQDWQVVGRQQRRPSAGEMELAFYNAAASNSPITKGVKFVKGIADKGFGKKKV